MKKERKIVPTSQKLRKYVWKALTLILGFSGTIKIRDFVLLFGKYAGAEWVFC